MEFNKDLEMTMMKYTKVAIIGLYSWSSFAQVPTVIRGSAHMQVKENTAIDKNTSGDRGTINERRNSNSKSTTNASTTSKANSSPSKIQSLFNTMVTPASRTTADSQVIINAQLNPHVSTVLNGGEACTEALSAQDLAQMESDQYLIQSFLNLYNIQGSEAEKIKGANLYMSILLQKLRSTVDAIHEKNSKTSNTSFLNGLSQKDLFVANFMNNAEMIKNLNALITAHQSLELPEYKIDGYLKLAIDEFNSCQTKGSSCAGQDDIWNRWFKDQGFGILSPMKTADMKISGSKTEKENFDIELPSGPYTSKELTKNLFEMINIYGGKNFDYFSYLKGQSLSATEKADKDSIIAPGKVVAGLMLKLANQRLVGYYKYQNCRLLLQNSSNTNVLENSFYNAVKGSKTSSAAVDKAPISTTPSTPPAIVTCDKDCGDGVKVTSGDKPLAVAPTKAPATEERVIGVNLCSKNNTSVIQYTSATTSKLIAFCPTAVDKNQPTCYQGKCSQKGFHFENGVEVKNVLKPGTEGLYCEGNALMENGAFVKWCGDPGGEALTCLKGKCAAPGQIFVGEKPVAQVTNNQCVNDDNCETGFQCNSNKCEPKQKREVIDGSKFVSLWDSKKKDYGVKVFDGCISGYVWSQDTCKSADSVRCSPFSVRDWTGAGGAVCRASQRSSFGAVGDVITIRATEKTYDGKFSGEIKLKCTRSSLNSEIYEWVPDTSSAVCNKQ